MQLRPYQAQAVEQTVPRLWEAGKSSVVLVAPTGSGKTVMGCALIRRIITRGHGQVWWLAHAQELIDQPADDLRGMGVAYAFVKSGRSADASSLVQLAQVQSMISRAVVPAPGCNRAFIVIDECFPMTFTTHASRRSGKSLRGF
jgi:superfamily II DNA or RNA helicase